MKIWTTLTLFLLAIILASPLLLSIQKTDGSFLINGSGDNLWHISLAVETKKQIPPTFPSISGTPLTNYHYFSDSIWGILSKVSGIEVTTLYFQIGSLIVCFLLTFLIFKIARYFIKSNLWSIVCVITTMFIGSAAFIKPLVIKGSAWSGNNFMLDQPYDQLINVHTGIGYLLILYGTLLTFKWLSTKKIKFGFFAAIVFAFLFGFKVFFAIPMAISFGIICLIQIKETRYKSVLPAVLLFVLSVLIFFSISDRTNISNNSPLVIRSGWLLTKMIESPDRFNLDNYYLKQLHYESNNNWLRLAQMEIEKIAIFILGNFWIKLLGIIYLIKTIKDKKKEKIFISISILISLVLPLFILPQPDPYNAVQFGQVAVMFMGLLFGLFIASSKLGKVVLIIFLPIFIYSIKTDFFNSNKFHEYLIPKEEVSALQYLKQSSNKNSVVIVDPIFDDRKMKVPALAERRTFYGGGKIPWLLGLDDTNRQEIQNQFFQKDTKDIFLENTINEYAIDYIYTSDPSRYEKLGFPLVFSNQKVYIFKTNIKTEDNSIK